MTTEAQEVEVQEVPAAAEPDAPAEEKAAPPPLTIGDRILRWIRGWLRVTSDNEQIVAYCNGLRRDHEALVGAYRQLAAQHSGVARILHETQRRLRWHEVGPLRVSKVALDKKDGERERREKLKLAEQNGDHSEQQPELEDVPEPERCGAVRTTDFGTFTCQLRVGHEGRHQSRLKNGQRAQWPDEPTNLTEIRPVAESEVDESPPAVE